MSAGSFVILWSVKILLILRLWATMGSEPTEKREIICELVTVTVEDQRKCEEIMGPKP